MKSIKRQSGFTIIEMLVVVTILAMLAGILVPVLEDGARSARDARRAADLKTMQSALESYKRANGEYPSTNGRWWGDAPVFGSRGYDANGYIPALVPDFLPALPKDPDSEYPKNDMGYVYRSDGTDYKFLANKTPESFPEGNPFTDSVRPTLAWQISTPAAYTW